MRLLVLSLLALSLLIRVYWVTMHHVALVDGDTVTFTARLSQDPIISGSGERFSLQIPRSDHVNISTSRFTGYEYGSVLRVSGKIKMKELGRGRKIISMSYPKITIVSGQSAILAGFFASLRSRLIIVFTAYLSQIQAGLLIGIVFGIKIPTAQAFSDAIRNAGLTHIIAASGMNVTMVAVGISSLLRRFTHRKLGLGITIVAILFYLMLCGFQASIVRAAIMGILAIVASLLGRQYTGIWVLGLTGWLMLLWNPDVLSDIGFQLSFLATLGILTIKPMLDQLFRRFKNALIDDVTTTTAAQIATIPVMLSAFGQYNLLSLIANALVLWMIPILMVVGSIGALFGLIAPIFSLPFFFVCLPLLLFMEGVIRFFGTHRIGIQIDLVPILCVIGYYLVLGSILLSIKRKQKANEKL